MAACCGPVDGFESILFDWKPARSRPGFAIRAEECGGSGRGVEGARPAPAPGGAHTTYRVTVEPLRTLVPAAGLVDSGEMKGMPNSEI